MNMLKLFEAVLREVRKRPDISLTRVSWSECQPSLVVDSVQNRESRRPQVKRFEVERALQNEELAREALNGYK